MVGVIRRWGAPLLALALAACAGGSAGDGVASPDPVLADDAVTVGSFDFAESELLAVHEGNFARYRIKPSEFRAWRDGW